eukprot:6205964-Pleurochrysis_carterae.AAC.1
MLKSDNTIACSRDQWVRSGVRGGGGSGRLTHRACAGGRGRCLKKALPNVSLCSQMNTPGVIE